MRKLTEPDWQVVVKTLTDNWPERIGKATGEQMLAYRNALSPYPVEWITAAIRDHAAASRFSPAPVELRKRCEQRASKYLGEASPSPEQADAELRAKVESDWADLRSRVEALSSDEREAHKARAMADDWRLEWLASRPSTSKAWTAMIGIRLRRGLGPHEPDVVLEVPPRVDGPRGNVCRELEEVL